MGLVRLQQPVLQHQVRTCSRIDNPHEETIFSCAAPVVDIARETISEPCWTSTIDPHGCTGWYLLSAITVVR